MSYNAFLNHPYKRAEKKMVIQNYTCTLALALDIPENDCVIHDKQENYMGTFPHFEQHLLLQ